MSLRDLLKTGQIEEYKSDPEQIKNEMELARQDLAAAKKMLSLQSEELWGWAHNAAYNAMLQAGRALMYSMNYRPRGQDQHASVIALVLDVYGKKFPPEVLQAFNKARIRRHESVYDRAGSISPSQAKNLVEKAELFVPAATKLLGL